jgi:glucan biosynthesis protein C
VLHCALAYIPDSSWPFMDWTASSWNLKLITLGVHMFRMPAFFLLSGFFGALLWQRRGTRAMLKNRVERIVLPFAVVVMLLYPLIAFCFSFGEGMLDDTAVPNQGALSKVKGLPVLPEGTMHLWFLYDLIFVTAIGAALNWRGNGRWNDLPCDGRNGFICEQSTIGP